MKKIKSLLLVLLSLFLLTSCKTKESSKTYLAFGSSITINVFEVDYDFNEIDELIDKLNMLTDRYTEFSSVKGVYYLNEHQNEEILVDPLLFDLIKYSINNSLINNTRYFEIGIGSLSDIYKDIFDNFNKETIDQTIFPLDLINKDYITDSSLIELNDSKKSIKLPEGLKLDLGGATKGYLIDLIKDILNKDSLKYLIDAGESSIYTNTINPKTNIEYRVGLTNPKNNNEVYSKIYLKEGYTLTTSAYYQKYFIYNDRIYSHILDSKTKTSVDTDILSISILTTSGAYGDILSTSLYMMGSAKATSYLNNNNIPAIMYLNDSTIKTFNGMDEYIIK